MATEILEIETNNFSAAEVEHSSCVVEIETISPEINVTEVFYEKGDAGMSAYEVAVANGFVGNEIDWLASLPASTIDILLNYNIAKL